MKKRQMARSFFSIAAMASMLTACADPTGPVFGDWYGFQPLPVPNGSLSIELVLDGAPNAQSGHYRLHRQSLWGGDMLFNRSDSLDGTWSIKNVTVQGHTWKQVNLNGAQLNIWQYVLLPNGYLVPTNDQGAPEMGQGGWGCCRLAPRARNSFGYGRA
ncbi:hypothetical protein AA0488_2153 [Kozakia baliensis NRIC 0488]|nr:hypothetical protein AA0488_2153 [Kozakia baliensis NRIC 0488]